MKEESQLSKHNYSQYSNKNNKANSEVAANNKPNNNTQKPKPEMAKTEVKVERTPDVVQPKPQLVQETVETVSLPDTVTGFVSNCAKLNVRKNPDVKSAVVCVLDVMSEVMIDVKQSTEDWFYVCCANGAEGYCMREYIDAHL